MKSLIGKITVAALGLSLAVAPMAASAAPWGVGVSVGGPGYSVHAGYANPGRHHWAPQPRYYGHPYGWHPGGGAYYDGFYGYAPAGYYGYYYHGGWYHHRRWGNGIWIYF